MVCLTISQLINLANYWGGKKVVVLAARGFSILAPPLPTGCLREGGLSCRPAINIVLSAACSASWRIWRMRPLKGKRSFRPKAGTLLLTVAGVAVQMWTNVRRRLRRVVLMRFVSIHTEATSVYAPLLPPSLPVIIQLLHTVVDPVTSIVHTLKCLGLGLHWWRMQGSVVLPLFPRGTAFPQFCETWRETSTVCSFCH